MVDVGDDPLRVRLGSGQLFRRPPASSAESSTRPSEKAEKISARGLDAGCTNVPVYMYNVTVPVGSAVYKLINAAGYFHFHLRGSIDLQLVHNSFSLTSNGAACPSQPSPTLFRRSAPSLSPTSSIPPLPPTPPPRKTRSRLAPRHPKPTHEPTYRFTHQPTYTSHAGPGRFATHADLGPTGAQAQCPGA